MQTEQIHAVEAELKAYETELYTLSNEYMNYAKDAAEKRVKYDVDYAQQMLLVSAEEGKQTVAEKEARVVVAVADVMLDVRIAEALASGARERLKALQSNLTSIQTRASLLKTERSLVNMMT